LTYLGKCIYILEVSLVWQKSFKETLSLCLPYLQKYFSGEMAILKHFDSQNNNKQRFYISISLSLLYAKRFKEALSSIFTEIF
jgi:hypothetical protein